MKNVCVVGLGSIGRRHSRLLAECGLEKLVGVDLRQDRRDQATNEIAFDLVTDNFTEVLETHHIDTVFITLPTAFHTNVAKEAAKKGCNLFIEKPLAASVDGLEEVRTIIKEKQLQSYIAYCYRFAPSVQRLKSIVDKGMIGKIYSARLHISTFLPDWHPWEDYRDFYMAKIEQGGGARLDESHGIDLLRWLFGEVESVFSFVETVSDLEISSDDLTVMNLKFESGLFAEAHFDLLGRSPRIGLELIGSDGTLLWDRIAGQISIFEAKSGEWECEDFGSGDFVKSYENQMAYVVDSFGGEHVPMCDFDDGLKTMYVLEAALQSSKSGELVKVPKL